MANKDRQSKAAQDVAGSILLPDMHLDHSFKIVGLIVSFKAISEPVPFTGQSCNSDQHPDTHFNLGIALSVN